MLSRCFLDFSVGVRASVIGLSQISLTQGCVMILTQGHIFKVKITVHILLNSLSGPQLNTVVLGFGP